MKEKIKEYANFVKDKFFQACHYAARKFYGVWVRVFFCLFVQTRRLSDFFQRAYAKCSNKVLKYTPDEKHVADL